MLYCPRKPHPTIPLIRNIHSSPMLILSHSGFCKLNPRSNPTTQAPTHTRDPPISLEHSPPKSKQTQRTNEPTNQTPPSQVPASKTTAPKTAASAMPGLSARKATASGKAAKAPGTKRACRERTPASSSACRAVRRKRRLERETKDGCSLYLYGDSLRASRSGLRTACEQEIRGAWWEKSA